MRRASALPSVARIAARSLISVSAILLAAILLLTGYLYRYMRTLT